MQQIMEARRNAKVLMSNINQQQVKERENSNKMRKINITLEEKEQADSNHQRFMLEKLQRSNMDKELNKALALNWQAHHKQKTLELKQDREESRTLANIAEMPFSKHQEQYLDNIKRSMERRENLLQNANSMSLKNPSMLTYSLASQKKE